VRIDSYFEGLDEVPAATSLEVKNEPMLFSCDFEAASRLGGPLTQRFIYALTPDWREAEDLILDSRVHMLMPGWYPCIPGWHHDDVPRSRSDGQPNYVSPEYESEHVMALMGDNCAPTEFAIGTCELPDVPIGKTIYKEWHPIVERMVRNQELKLRVAPMHKLLGFDNQTFHQGVRATSGGWRFFIRASRYTHREPVNEVRRQVQVYLEVPMEGW
jgi:hypothetical protein